MQLIGTIPTPWTPCALAFAHDGSRLAIGGGSRYCKAGGGVLMVDLQAEQSELVPSAMFTSRHNRAPTVSGVCFSSDDRHLAVATNYEAKLPGPVTLMEGSNLHFSPVASFVSTHQAFFWAPTGVQLHQGRVITCNLTKLANDALDVWELPYTLNVALDCQNPHLAHSRIAVVRDSAITGGVYSNPPEGRLVSITVSYRGREATAIPADSVRRITAIIADPSANGFVTGGADGELDQWVWGEQWQQQRLRPAVPVKRAPDPSVIWGHYNPSSIVALCFLRDASHWITLSAGGDVQLWSGTRCDDSWQVPVPGTPRSLAANPMKDVVAIGVKQAKELEHPSVVLLVDVKRDSS